MSRPLRVVGAGSWLLAVVLTSGCDRPSNTYAPPPPAEVEVAAPVEREVLDAPVFTAITDVFEKVELRARVKGFLEKVHYTPDEVVEPGQVLFTIDPRTFQAQVASATAAVASAEAAFELARVNLDKVRQLEERSAATDLEVREREAAYNATQAELDASKARLDAAKLDLEFTTVTAPIRGRISRNLVDPGALVGAPDPTLLASIYNDDQIYAYFTANERELLEFRRRHPERRNGDRPEMPVFLALADEQGFPHEGRFDSGEPVVDPATGTVRLRAVFDNPTGLLAGGLFGRVKVPLAKVSALLVPEVAVGTDQGGRFVLVVNDKNVVERRGVKVGPVEEDGTIRVLEGVGPGDRIVVNGVLRARPGATVKPVASTTAASPEAKKAAEAVPTATP
ncbi:MAG: efflux RND transporter periplasmic adaptor subunit [Phycisphaerales bacterium]|nr:efflux RND transporter periplasmic adaptor subunit [Phycisphaerales bacterium]